MAALRILANQVLELTRELEEKNTLIDTLVARLDEATTQINGYEDKVEQLCACIQRIQNITVAAELLNAPQVSTQVNNHV